MKTVNESIFNGKKHIIPMAEVSHIGKYWYKGEPNTPENIKGYVLIMSKTTWNSEIEFYNNSIFLSKDEGGEFLKAWCMYRHELEVETLVDQDDSEVISGTIDALNSLSIRKS